MADPENFVGVGGSWYLFWSPTYGKEGRTNLPGKQLDPMGFNCFSRVSVPNTLRKLIATCDFQGVGGEGENYFQLRCRVHIIIHNPVFL